MNKIIILLMLFTAVTYSQYQGIDTLNRSVITTSFDTLRLGPGQKSIEVNNKTTGTLQIAFRHATTNLRDTVNFIPVNAGNKVLLLNRRDSVIFVKSSVAGTVTAIVYYGQNDPPVIYYHTNANGEYLTAISNGTTNIYVQDTTKYQRVTRGGVDTVSSTNIDTLSRQLTGDPTTLNIFSLWYRGYITPDDTIEISTDISFPADNTREVQEGEVYNIDQTRASSETNYYIRRKGTGTPRWRWGLGGD